MSSQWKLNSYVSLLNSRHSRKKEHNKPWIWWNKQNFEPPQKAQYGSERMKGLLGMSVRVCMTGCQVWSRRTNKIWRVIYFIFVQELKSDTTNSETVKIPFEKDYLSNDNLTPWRKLNICWFFHRFNENAIMCYYVITSHRLCLLTHLFGVAVPALSGVPEPFCLTKKETDIYVQHCGLPLG